MLITEMLQVAICCQRRLVLYTRMISTQLLTHLILLVFTCGGVSSPFVSTPVRAFLRNLKAQTEFLVSNLIFIPFEWPNDQEGFCFSVCWNASVDYCGIHFLLPCLLSDDVFAEIVAKYDLMASWCCVYDVFYARQPSIFFSVCYWYSTANDYYNSIATQTPSAY